ncbi:hypothetical protein CRG98_030181 [Punica granatum]|uniref:Uncharacterized protein n=1 Tax=Punica granatum TaxID=22663 RepID=A0A2I0IZM1_PUNGR|nr:hypothetical protein CRG98_030181 [Punica granatum]
MGRGTHGLPKGSRPSCPNRLPQASLTLLLQVQIVLSGEQYTRHCSHVQALGDARARLPARARSCSAALACVPAPVTVRPTHPLHARPRPGCSLRTSLPAHAQHVRLLPVPACASNHAPELPAAPVPAHARPVARPSLPERAALAPERPSKDSTESPDSQSLPRLFPRIPRLGIPSST